MSSRLTWVFAVGVRDEQRLRDLRVRRVRSRPRSSTSRSRSVSVVEPGSGVLLAGGGACVNCSIKRRVTLGESRASPAATTWTALQQVVRQRVLQQEAARAGAQRLVHVLVEIERREDEHAGRPGRHRRRRSAASPRGRPSRASGCPSARRRAARDRRARPPLRRWPPRRPPRCRGRNSRSTTNPLRTSAWSSATATRITRSSSYGSAGGDAEAAAGAGSGLQRAAVDRDPLAHADETVPADRSRCRSTPRPSSVISDLHGARLVADERPRRVRAGVLQHVGQCFLHDAVRGEIDAAWELDSSRPRTTTSTGTPAPSSSRARRSSSSSPGAGE